MSSCPTPSTDAFPTPNEQLLTVLGKVPDPRDPRGVRYPLAGVLAVAVTAAVAGSCSVAAIGQWVADAPRQSLACLGLRGGSAPDESTLRKLFARLDADALDRALGVWMFTRTAVIAGRRVVALDGKTVRGARRVPERSDDGCVTCGFVVV